MQRPKAPELRFRETPGVLLGDRHAHHVRAGQTAHFRAALDAAMSTYWHQPGVRAADVSARELKVHNRADIVAAVAVLGNPHAPNDDRVAGLAESLREAVHLRLALPGAPFQIFPGEAARFCLGLLPAEGASGDKLAVYPIVLDQMFQHAVEECDVSASVDLEIIIGHA